MVSLIAPIVSSLGEAFRFRWGCVVCVVRGPGVPPRWGDLGTGVFFKVLLGFFDVVFGHRCGSWL